MGMFILNEKGSLSGDACEKGSRGLKYQEQLFLKNSTLAAFEETRDTTATAR